jgi:hypothetical protein
MQGERLSHHVRFPKLAGQPDEAAPHYFEKQPAETSQQSCSGHLNVSAIFRVT